MDCGGSRGLVRIQRAHSLALVRIDLNHHAAQEQRNVGRTHLVDKALRVLGTGELLLKVRKAKTRMNALAQNAAQMLFAFNDGHVRTGLMCGKRSRHASRSTADDDHVEGLRRYRRYSSELCTFVAHIKRRHPSAPPLAAPLPAKNRHPPTAPRWGRSPARGQGSQQRGSGKNRSGTDPCRHDSGA